MWLLAFVSFMLSFSVHAAFTITSQIHDIDYGQGNDQTFLLLKSGHVAWVKKNETKFYVPMEFSRQSRLWTTFTLNDLHEIESIKAAATPKAVRSAKSFAFLHSEENYTPTVLESLDVAKQYFHESRYVNKESQCYNRAHIWSYEWFTNHQVNSNKTWIFFTRRYIRRFKFEWWFHVSPSVVVNDNGVMREKLMDVKYSRGPIDLKRWTDIFMLDDANCPQVQTYSDYANYPESGSCYTMRSSMFYYQPVDIESKETWGTLKTNWYEAEVKQAYLEAFDQEI